MSDTDEMVRLMGHAADLCDKAQDHTNSNTIIAALANAAATLRMVAASVTPAPETPAEQKRANLPSVIDADEARRRLKVLRATADLTQADVAKATGISVPTISRFETGQGQMGGLAMLALLRWLESVEEQS